MMILFYHKPRGKLMDYKKLAWALKGAVGVFVLVGLFCCLFYFPYQTGLISFAEGLMQMDGIHIAELVIYWLSSIPCFIVLAYAYLVSGRLEDGRFFSKKTAYMIRHASIWLGVTSILFCLSNVVFACLLPVSYEVFYAFLGLVGLTIAALLFISSKMIDEGAKTKEENEEII